MGPHNWRPTPALAALLDASSYSALAACRGILSTAPRQGRTKAALASELMVLCQDTRLHEKACRHLLAGHTVDELRKWLSTMRHQGLSVPPVALVGHRKDHILNAIISIDLQRGGTAQCVDTRPQHEPAVGAAGSHKCMPAQCVDTRPQHEPAAGAAGSHERVPRQVEGQLPDGVLVAYGTTAEPLQLRRKLGKKWWKIGKSQRKFRNATRAARSKQLTQALREILDDHPSETVAVIRGLVSSKTGIALTGAKSREQRLFFDRQLLKLTARRATKKQTRARFKLAVSRARRDS